MKSKAQEIALNDAASNAGRRHPADDTFARDILGANGLFIADVTKHGPYASFDHHGDILTLGCICGWSKPAGQPESYFDHIGEE